MVIFWGRLIPGCPHGLQRSHPMPVGTFTYDGSGALIGSGRSFARALDKRSPTNCEIPLRLVALSDAVHLSRARKPQWAYRRRRAQTEVALSPPAQSALVHAPDVNAAAWSGRWRRQRARAENHLFATVTNRINRESARTWGLQAARQPNARRLDMCDQTPGAPSAMERCRRGVRATYQSISATRSRRLHLPTEARIPAVPNTRLG